MKSHRLFSERGATLVYVALILVVLLAFVSLAVDVGNLYAERRHMQNAADAGALAGAYELCHGTASAWKTTAESYATTNNRAQTANATLNNWTVTVVASETADTYLAGIIGINTVNVSATAAAACGQADRACGLWPIAFSQQVWLHELQGNCGEIFYIWNGSNEQQIAVDCDVYDCDVPEPYPGGVQDGDNDVISGDSRAWLDFSSALSEEYPDDCQDGGCGGGAAELNCQLRDGSDALLTLPVCIDGRPGAIASARNPVNSRSGQAVSVPIYDDTQCSGGCGSADAYNAVNFACVTVLGWEQHLLLPNMVDEHAPPWRDFAIAVAVNCDTLACTSTCGGTTGGPPVPGGVNAVSLVQ